MDKPQNKFLSVVYQLYSVAENGEKQLEEQTGDERPFEFITGFGISLDRFEEEVSGLEKGEHFDFTLQPGEAFGEYVPEGKHKLDRITLMDNEDHQFMAKVVKIEEDGVTVDTNHPLAGKLLNFTGRVIENRDATEEEVQHLIKHLTGGCGHNCGGCDHEGCGHDHEGCDHHHEHEGGCGCGHCH